MKIIQLKAENLKRLKAVDITPEDGNPIVTIAGRNAQGKTSVLDAIYFALAGASAQKDTSRPIRDGEDHAEVTLDLGDLVVKRKWTANDKSYLSVESKDGAVYRSPQQVLDRLTGALTFDPLEFSRMDPKGQRETLLSLVNLPVSLEDLDRAKAEVFEKRREVGRELEKAKARLDGGALPEDCPKVEVAMGEVLHELEKAVAHNRAIDERRDGIRHQERVVEDLSGNLVRLRKELEEKADLLAFETTRLESFRLGVEGLEPIDTAAIKERMAGLDESNRLARKYQESLRLKEEAAALEKERESLSDKLKAIDEAKAEMLEKAAFPVQGLGFDESGVTYNGIPFAQCSGAEQLRISLSTAMALNPKLRVVRITDGSLLDSDNLAMIRTMAEEKNFQIWLEKVDDSGSVGIVIEDGEVKA